jgi:hypothetical protein
VSQSAISKPSDLPKPSPQPSGGKQGPESFPRELGTPERARTNLPEPMKLAFAGGMRVELAQDQRYADDLVVRAGERGRTICPSSQAAAWVVHFPRVTKKHRVVPEHLLRLI